MKTCLDETGHAVIAAFYLLALVGPVTAQDASQAANTRRQEYDACFAASAKAQMAHLTKPYDINMIAENAFVACATEERALTALLDGRLLPQMVSTVMLSIKLELKRSLNANSRP